MVKSVKAILSFLLFIVNSNVIAQSEIDNIPVKQVSISGVSIGSDVTSILKKFGKPDSITLSFNEMHDIWEKRYEYENSFFIASDNHFKGFKILDSTFYFDFGKIKITDDEKKLKQLFPNSYKNRYLNSSNNELVKVRIGNSDDYCIFILQEKKIIEIHTWEDL